MHRNIHGAPGPIVERADRSALASDYRRIMRRLIECGTALRRLDSAALFVGGLRHTSDADIADLMADALNMIDDAKSQIEAARAALDASITTAMEDA